MHSIKSPSDFLLWRNSPSGARASSLSSLHDHTHTQHTTHTHTHTNTLGTTPLGEISAQCRGLYLTTHTYTHMRQTSMPPVGFEPAIPGKRGAVDPLLRRRGYWDRLQVIYCSKNNRISKQTSENKIDWKKADLKISFSVMISNEI